jgi:CHAT domain-containing protein
MRKRLLGHSHPDVADSLNNLAALYSSQGRYSEAEPLYRQALEMRKRLLGDNHPSVATSLNNLAALYSSQGNIAQVLEFLEAGLQVEEQNLTTNLSIGFERQKRDYIKTVSGTTNWAISLHLNSAPNNPDAANLAFKTIFQRKGRVLDVLTNNLQILRQRVDDKNSQKLINELSDAYSRLTSLTYYPPEKLSANEYPKQISDLENKIKELEDKLSRRSVEFRQQKQSETASLENVQKLIPADAALVEIFRYQPFNPKAKENQRFGKPRYAAYILTSTDKSQGIDLGETAQIESTLELFHEPIRDSSSSVEQVKQSGRDLDKLIMEPVRKLLGNKRKILISPDGALNLIPFEALVDENNHYLVENYSFTYLTSGRDLLRLQNQFPSKQPPVVMGNPNYNKPGESVAFNTKTSDTKLERKQTLALKDIFPILLGTGEQATEIAQFLGVKPLLDSAASEAKLKQVQSPTFLIIGTHGFFKDSLTPESQNTVNDNPLLLSGLIFAGYKQQQSGSNSQSDEDGILSAQETTGLNLLGTKIVVLSACDTAVGKDSTGEGIYSLRRALVIAGSESQVISLWKVADDATKDLMIAYFKKVLGKDEKKQGRSEALRQVQLEMLQGEKYQHPYYWAAFIPSGDWREMP